MMNFFLRCSAPAILLACGLGLGCSAEPEAAADASAGGGDAASEVAYKGQTIGGAIPDFLPTQPDLDAGPSASFDVDKTCCTTAFSISDLESPAATGKVRGHGLLAAGLDLKRGGGNWTASSCIPLNTSAYYWYEFVEPVVGATPTDAGSSDGGPTTVTVIRVADDQPKGYDGSGEQVNYLTTQSGCK